jgi:hypothetical protein
MIQRHASGRWDLADRQELIDNAHRIRRISPGLFLAQ